MEESPEENKFLEQFRVLYKENAPSLILYARKYVDHTTAEDIVQDVFLKIWNKRAFLFLGEGIKGYLYSSVRHACLDYLKHLDIKTNVKQDIINQLKIQELYFNDDHELLKSNDERFLKIYNEINKLPPKCREIFSMAYMEERKASEIATLLNISKRTVEAQLYKALKILRENLLIIFILWL